MNIYTSKTEYLEAELRRLHEVNQELLEALKLAMPDLHGYWRMKAEEAIAKAQEQK